MAALQKVKKVGSGTYGIVYEAKGSIPIDDEKSEWRSVAVKRNLSDLSVDGIGNLVELDMLSRLKGHPFVVDLLMVSFYDPFTSERPMTPFREDVRHLKDDKIHFIMEYVPIPADKFIDNEKLATPIVVKYLMAQFLLGIEYIHAKNVTHRDLKPQNLLISNAPEDGYKIRICDFGMSQVITKESKPTFGVTSAWYRAPEICCEWSNYGVASDMWSVGCILYEFCCGRPYLQGVRDDNSAIFSAIVGKSPRSLSRYYVQKIMAHGKKLRLSGGFPIRRYSFLEQMNLSAKTIQTWNETPGTIEQFIDLLEHILQINPEERYTATQALNHPFFNGHRAYIEDCRAKYPPIPSPLPAITIIDCIERTWMKRLVFGLYEMRDRLGLWYERKIIFHAIDLFDRYLEWAFSGGMPLRPAETPLLGRLHSRSETELRFYVCLYLLHKYYSVLTIPLDWCHFAPKAYQTDQNRAIAEQFEIVLVRDVAKYSIYRDTLLEAPELSDPSINLAEADIRTLLEMYWNVCSWFGRSIRALYRVQTGLEIDSPENHQSPVPLPLPVQ